MAELILNDRGVAKDLLVCILAGGQAPSAVEVTDELASSFALVSDGNREPVRKEATVQ